MNRMLYVAARRRQADFASGREPRASRAFGVPSVRSSASCPSRVSAEASVRAAGGGGWLSTRPCSSTRSYRRCQCVSGYSRCRLRYRPAWDHALCRAVLGVFARTLVAFYVRTARVSLAQMPSG
jgi:hypothetical protein